VVNPKNMSLQTQISGHNTAMTYPLNLNGVPPAELRKARRRYLARLSALLGRPLAGPMEVGLILTYRCNHGCAFCALPEAAKGREREISPELFTKAIDDLAEAGCEQVSLTGGGEPLMYPRVGELVQRIREKGMACSVCTNGALLKPELVQHWARLGVHLAVSFNAATAQTYAAVHRAARPGDYERTLEMLRLFHRTAEMEGGDGSFISMNFVVHKTNFTEIEAMAALARQVGAAQIQYRLIQPRSGQADLMLNDEELQKARTDLRRVEEAAAGDPHFTVQVAGSLRLPECRQPVFEHPANGVTPNAALDDRTRVPCIEGYVASYIDADGTVFPCCMRSVNIGNHIMGSVAESSFTDIWHGAAYQAFRRESFSLAPESIDAGENSCAHCPKAKHFLYLVDEFTPGNYLDLCQQQLNSLSQKCADFQQRLKEHMDLPPRAMRPLFVAHELPPRVPAGARFNAQVTIRNNSPVTWPGYDVADDHAVGLGYHLLDKRARMLRFDNNPRAYLAGDLPPGAEITLTLPIQAPDEPGNYWVELAVVQERVSWFEQAGGVTLRVPLEVAD